MFSQAHLGTNDNRLRFPRGKTLGGSSAINYMLFVRGNAEDYDRWEEMFGARGWGYKSVLPFFKKMENFEGPFFDPEYRGKGGPVTVTEVVVRWFELLLVVGSWDFLIGIHQPQTPVTNAFVEAGRELGHKIGYDYNGESQASILMSCGATRVDFSACRKDSHWVKGMFRRTECDGARPEHTLIQPWHPFPILQLSLMVSMCFTLIMRLMSLGTVQVTSIILEGKKAIGVRFERHNSTGTSSGTAFARREVILSAGAIDSPKLLMISGIGPREHLQQHGIEVRATRDQSSALNSTHATGRG